MRTLWLAVGVACAFAGPAFAQSDNEHFPMAAGPLPAGAVSAKGGPAFSGAVKAGDTLYISGLVDLDPATGKPPLDAAVGAKLILDSMKRTIQQAGMTMDDLVWVQVFAADLRTYASFNETYRTYFKGPLPARAFIGAGSLLAGGHFEVMGIAVKPKRK